MIEAFERGKYYRYVNKAGISRWGWSGGMSKVLDGKARLCTMGKSEFGALEGLGTYPWCWKGDLENFEEVDMSSRFVVGKSYIYGKNSIPQGWDWVERMKRVLDGKPVKCIDCDGVVANFEGVGRYCWADGLENWREEADATAPFKFGQTVWVRDTLKQKFVARIYVGKMGDRSKKFVTVENKDALRAYGGGDVLVVKCFKYAEGVCPVVTVPFRSADEVVSYLGKKVLYSDEPFYFALMKTGIKVDNVFLTFSSAFKQVTFLDGVAFGKEEN